MYLRKKKNKSGVISVQIIDKSSGRYKVIKTIGSSSNLSEVENLVIQGKQWIKQKEGILELDFTNNEEQVKTFIHNIEQLNRKGIDLLLGKIYNEIGFDELNEFILKKLVLLRLSNPSSKLKTVDLLYKYYSINIDDHKVYRYLDKLYNNQKEQIQRISYNHTLKVLDGLINIVFYDVTTLYFQIDNEDQIRKRGFSKEGKHQNPQIVLGLLVSVDGYPLAFEIFEGNKFEGHTMLPVIDIFKEKYQLKQLVIVADSGLLSYQNIKELQEKNYEFILGARIKNQSKEIKDKIVALNLKNGDSEIIEKDDDLRLIISYSDKRASKDRHNRERGLKRLEKQLNKGKLTKANINNRGYNKYLIMDGDIKISINIEKFKTDAKWDGLKGYITNSNLSKDEIIENYSHLWKIEKAFRISKHDLKIRPIYHRLQRRIEAHITINFAAYKVYKELERQLKEKKSDLSPEKAIEIAKTIFAIKVRIPNTNQYFEELLLLKSEQKDLAELFDF
jgi:transposase